MPLCLQTNPEPVHQDALPILHQEDFLRIANVAHRSFGLDLGRDKQGFVAARLSRLVRELGFASFHQYSNYLLTDRTGVAPATLADRLTTNHTSFFREPAHFDFLRAAILPAFASRSHINIWSAGCSSGEEPYSIAISALDSAPHLSSRLRIHATDISARVLQRASAAVYTTDRIAAIPSMLRNGYFAQTAEHDTFRIVPRVRSIVEFAHVNLMERFAGRQYAVIFCRNVMLYFDRPTHQSLIQRFITQLEPGGFLFIGQSESLNGIDHSLASVGPAIYRKTAPVGGRSFASLSHKQPATLTPFPFPPEEVYA